MSTTIYPARKILTMNPNQPEVTHVAVRDGRILGAGTLADLEGWGDYTLDERFADKVLMPGLIEGHAHTMEGAMWNFTYVGWFDRMDPDGRVWDGVKTVDALVARMAEAEARMEDPDAPLLGWGLDPIYMDNVRVTRADLDRVSATRPVGIMHASGHILNVNTKGLELAGLLHQGNNHPGIPLGADGLPTGELKSPEIMMPAGKHVGMDRAFLASDAQGLWNYGKLCVRAGVTTSSDLGQQLNDDLVAMFEEVTGNDRFPACLVAFRINMGVSPAELVDYTAALKDRSTDRLELGRIKVVADGSIQGFSARLLWPGYYNGAPNGMWYVAPDQLAEIFDRALKAGVQVHTHTNGDEATQLVIETLETALRKTPDFDHRFTLQHCQLANAAQFRRMARLGMCVNLFANHHFYWGDEHYALTVGPERADRMNACRTALDAGVPMTIHSDAPVTPLGPLFTAWSAVNRLTASGRTQGEGEKITVAQALHAITMGAAVTMKMDHLVGSIEVGKRADFAVLEEDPTEVDPLKLKDIPVWGTVQGGRIFPASDL
ncbi:amidohydrolase [Marinibacterium profundimaris]|uniref:Amidohydrolase n=1 Tax=Marinibacterium profundimaris TaxID=1679460 RepID=A0A225NT84_9RHOB|nr:amidohydrolase [Marinibacterium profundimaris]OWU74820.1 amidohydrolase [Marinibacterium profundimaris]